MLAQGFRHAEFPRTFFPACKVITGSLEDSLYRSARQTRVGFKMLQVRQREIITLTIERELVIAGKVASF